MQVNETTLLAQELASALSQFGRVGKHQSSVKGIKQSEYMLLVALAHCTSSTGVGIKVSALSTRLQITPAAVTHMINSLEEGGYVERQADPTDRRIVLIKPTDKAEQLIQEMKEEHLEYLQDLVRFLGENNSRELLRLLTLSLVHIKERKNDNAR
ncbi:MAG TPA: MarR family transcriptional regulator [Candidatus Deferrimicrobium sp.]|nr:MarR family transcriptional regulator [Candidatus Deferrimicrobium sp.]